MLNTDLHNPNLKERMSLEAFIKNNQSMELPLEYVTNIYKNIANDPLMACFPRLYDFSKSEEVFSIIKSKKNFKLEKIKESIELTETEKETVYYPNLHLYYLNNNKIDKIYYPFLDCFENFNYLISYESTKASNYKKELVFLLWEDFFCNFMILPNKFFDSPDENTVKTIENICLISQSFNLKENIDKLLVLLFILKYS